MKNWLLKSEKWGPWAIGCSFVLMLLHIPFYEVILFLSSFVLCYYYIVSSGKDWVEQYGEENRRFLRWVGLCFAFSVLTFMYKFLYWPLAGMLNFIAFFMLLSVVLLLRKKTEESFYRFLQTRALILLIIVFICVAIPRHIIVQAHYWDDPEFAKLKVDYMDNPSDTAIAKKYYEYKRRK